MTARDIECAVASHFGWRKNIIIPNISWGAGLHECDLLVLTPADIAHEVEIKISRSDLKADQKKKHHHRSDRIRCLWFAVPVALVESALELCPEHAGILAIKESSKYLIRGLRKSSYRSPVTVVRPAQVNRSSRKWTAEERLKLTELGVMRYWSRRDL